MKAGKRREGSGTNFWYLEIIVVKFSTLKIKYAT